LCDNFPNCPGNDLGYRVVPRARILGGVLQQRSQQLSLPRVEDAVIIQQRAGKIEKNFLCSHRRRTSMGTFGARAPTVRLKVTGVNEA
jgi:hypothetical protein